MFIFLVIVDLSGLTVTSKLINLNNFYVLTVSAGAGVAIIKSKLGLLLECLSLSITTGRANVVYSWANSINCFKLFFILGLGFFPEK